MRERPNDFGLTLGRALDTLRLARFEPFPDRCLGHTILGFRELLHYEDDEAFSERERPILDMARERAVRFLLENLSGSDAADPATWLKYYSFLKIEATDELSKLVDKVPACAKMWEDFCEQLPVIARAIATPLIEPLATVSPKEPTAN